MIIFKKFNTNLNFNMILFLFFIIIIIFLTIFKFSNFGMIIYCDENFNQKYILFYFKKIVE